MKSISKSLLTLFVLTLSCAAISAPNGGDPVAGKEKAAACVACHGADGISPSPAFPNLAGQYIDYLEQALHSYKSGDRNNPIMAGFAAALSEQDIKDLAAYYGRQTGLSVVNSQ